MFTVALLPLLATLAASAPQRTRIIPEANTFGTQVTSHLQ